ncbi:helix-turn-helix transcriptional regulator [Devosia sp. SD17-2]|uniref:helix-turn-helix domain-containing protein n=1 Tax=Devosia sp. SD17-2 TaxID=2976459 RepID=UPI0031F327A7
MQQLRVEAGKWLRSLREEAGISQRKLAELAGIEYYTFISQLESGRGRVPQGQYFAFSKALKVPLREFVKTMTRYYDPITYYALFEAKEEPESVTEDVDIEDLAERLQRLEALVAKRAANSA